MITESALVPSANKEIEMIKLMVFLSRLPHVDREAFKAYYENKHAPMIPSRMPMLSGYERNYPDVSKLRSFRGLQEIMCVIRADEATFLDNT